MTNDSISQMTMSEHNQSSSALFAFPRPLSQSTQPHQSLFRSSPRITYLVKMYPSISPDSSGSPFLQKHSSPVSAVSDLTSNDDKLMVLDIYEKTMCFADVSSGELWGTNMDLTQLYRLDIGGNGKTRSVVRVTLSSHRQIIVKFLSDSLCEEAVGIIQSLAEGTVIKTKTTKDVEVELAGAEVWDLGNAAGNGWREVSLGIEHITHHIKPETEMLSLPI